MSNINRKEYIYKCPNCGYLPYADQITLFSKVVSPEYGNESSSITRCQCNKCGRKDLLLCSIDDEDAIDARSKANLEEEYIDIWDIESEKRKNEIYEKASSDKLNRLLELMQRRHRLESLLVLEYFDGYTNGTDESVSTLIYEMYDILKKAKSEGKISEDFIKKEDRIVQDSLPYACDEIDKAVIQIMNEENHK